MDVGISINRKLYNIFIIIIICNYTKYNRTKQGETYFSVGEITFMHIIIISFIIPISGLGYDCI